MLASGDQRSPVKSYGSGEFSFDFLEIMHTPLAPRVRNDLAEVASLIRNQARSTALRHILLLVLLQLKGPHHHQCSDTILSLFACLAFQLSAAN